MADAEWACRSRLGLGQVVARRAGVGLVEAGCAGCSGEAEGAVGEVLVERGNGDLDVVYRCRPEMSFLAKERLVPLLVVRAQCTRMALFIVLKLIKKVLDECVWLFVTFVRAGCTERRPQTSSFSAQPPHHLIRSKGQRLPIGADMNRYCAPPRRKQWVVNLPFTGRTPARLEKSESRF